MASGQTAKITKSFSLGGQSLSVPSSSASVDTTVKETTTASAGATNFHRSIPKITANLLRMVGLSVSGACTIKTNSSSAPDQTFTYTKAGGFVWDKDEENVISNPITDDIQDIYITVPGSSAVDVSLFAAIDQPGVGS